MVLSGPAGFPGAGSYSRRTDKAFDASLTIDVEPVVRSWTGGQAAEPLACSGSSRNQ